MCARLGLAAASPRLEQALTHPSYSNEQRGHDVVDNQRLEFLGDAVLGLCASELLMEAFGDVDEGELTLMRAALVNTEALASSAHELGLADALALGRGADAAGERHRTNVLADAIEAIIGSVYLDAGLDAARDVSRRMLSERIAKLVEDGGIQRDAKSRLQELLQARGLPPPSYVVTSVDGPAHARVFEVHVEATLGTDEGAPTVRGEGTGGSKKSAEQAAALAALLRLAEK